MRNRRKTIRLNESTLNRIIKESVKRVLRENQRIFTIGDQNDDIGYAFKVELGTSSYLGSIFFNVFGVFSEQEALDAAIDFCEKHNIDSVFAIPEDAEEFPDDYITAGNHGLAIPSDQVIITEIS